MQAGVGQAAPVQGGKASPKPTSAHTASAHTKGTNQPADHPADPAADPTARSPILVLPPPIAPFAPALMVGGNAVAAGPAAVASAPSAASPSAVGQGAGPLAAAPLAATTTTTTTASAWPAVAVQPGDALLLPHAVDSVPAAPSGTAAAGALAFGLPSAITPPPAAAAASPAQPANGVSQQLAPVLVQLAHGPSGHTVILQLDPIGLGHVQVRIDRDSSGTPAVQVTAERPETLKLLVADHAQLHRALDNAGVAADGRTVSFSLTTPGGSPSGATDDSSSGAAGGGNAAGQQNGRNQGRAASPYPATDDEHSSFTTQSAWLRAGVDITA